MHSQELRDPTATSRRISTRQLLSDSQHQRSSLRTCKPALRQELISSSYADGMEARRPENSSAHGTIWRCQLSGQGCGQRFDERLRGRVALRVENPVGYLQRSVINLGVNRTRRRRVAARHPVTPPGSASTPEIDETWNAVMRLPAKQRAVVVLRFWQDMTVEAIADNLCWPAGSVKSTLHRALRRLKEELK